MRSTLLFCRGARFFQGFIIAVGLAGLLASATPAEAGYASIVMDAETGDVLHQADADTLNYPASLTKMMTLYLIFEGLDSGRLKLDKNFLVSAHAASQPPTKLGLVAGDTVTVRDVILGLVTTSANDAAAVAAENMAGSEPAFADRMTQKARQLGMRNTTFRNASGLPDPEQQSTARDLALLARALYRDFPRHYHYFSAQDFTFRGTTYANHNNLMKSFEGMDGVKTGFIRASGFNLASSAVRDNRRLIGVVMGGQSARARDLHMADLLNSAFAGKAPTSTLVAQAEPRSSIAGKAASVVRALSPISTAEAATPKAPADAVRKGEPTGDRWIAQLGAFQRLAAAEKVAANAAAKLKISPKAIQIAAPAKGEKDQLYRVRMTNLTRQAAQDACQTLGRARVACTVVAPPIVKAAAAKG